MKLENAEYPNTQYSIISNSKLFQRGIIFMKKILVVDNDRLILEFMTDILSKEGYQVMTAESGLSALDILKSNTPDVIFTDLVMPDIDGRKLCKIIRGMERLKDSYVVVLSATLTEEPLNSVELGINACIAKGPFNRMARNIIRVLDEPDLAHSRCLSGEVIGGEGFHRRGIIRELLSVKNHFEVILERISEGILEITSDGEILYANPVALSLIPVPEEELLGSGFVDLFAEYDRHRLSELIRDEDQGAKRIEEDSPVEMNGRLFALSIVPLGKDRFTNIIVINDITERKMAEEALTASESRLRDLIEKNADAIIIVDSEGIARFANPAAGTLFGKRPGEFVGDPFGFPLAAGETTEIDLLTRDRGPTVAEMRVVEIEWKTKRAYLASIRDITERKDMEESLRKANETILEQQKELIEEERLKVLLQMAGATAHEMNQPLTALLGNIDLLKFDKDDPEKMANRLNVIVTAGKRISSTVKKIQNIRHVDTKPYVGDKTIIDINQDINILLIEESDEDFATITALLRDTGRIKLSRSKGIDDAMKALDQNQIDIIISALQLPDGDGFKLLEVLGKNRIETPVVIVADHGSEMVASELIQAGAYGYLTKDLLSREALSSRLNSALEKARLKREIKMAQDKMAEMATMDELTGLYNRRYFMDVVEREIARTKRHGTGLALSMMDLDHFKKINDTYGHSAGDTVLSEIGKILKKWARQTDLVCRYGGEEFAFIMPNTGLRGARVACERLREMVSKHPFEYETSRFQITISIGIAVYNGSADQSPKDLIKKADGALYRAKEEGRDRVCD